PTSVPHSPRTDMRFTCTSFVCWLRPLLRLRAVALALRVGLAFAAAHHEPRHFAALYTGCVTASSKAGSPFSTTASARRIAGPSSFGSVIGPSAYHPLLWANFA